MTNPPSLSVPGPVFLPAAAPRSSIAASMVVPTFALPLFALALLALLLPGRAAAQAIPAAEAAPISTGFQLPSAAGSLQYSLSANESLTSGYYGGQGVDTATGINGNVAYISPAVRYPFSMIFSAGRSFSTSSQPSTTYLDLALSQVINTRNWDFVLSDSVAYLPATPSTGLAGVPGVGDLGVPPVQVGIDTGQGVLTGYSTRVTNAASLNAQRRLTGKTSLQFSGIYTLLRFVGSSGNAGLDSTGESGTAGLSHTIDPRNTVSGNYAYTTYSYGGQPGFTSQTVSGQYAHQFSRQLRGIVSAGPQWTGGSSGTQQIPTSLNLYANAGVSYSARYTTYSLTYTRGTNSGFGVSNGTRSDSIYFSASHVFARVWNAAATSAYTRSSTLGSNLNPTSYTYQTEVEGAQVSRALRRNLSAYASYTLENQTSPSGAVGADLFSGFFQVATFGLTYSPASFHFGPR